MKTSKQNRSPRGVMEQSAVGRLCFKWTGARVSALCAVGPGSLSDPSSFFSHHRFIPWKLCFLIPQVINQFLWALKAMGHLLENQKDLFLFLSASGIYLTMVVAPHTFAPAWPTPWFLMIPCPECFSPGSRFNPLQSSRQWQLPEAKYLQHWIFSYGSMLLTF